VQDFRASPPCLKTPFQLFDESSEAVSKPFIMVVERGSAAADVETTDLRSFGASASSATEAF
jgi:hypothetical protein